MSLIHDSLRKLEKNQANNPGSDPNVEKFKSENVFNAKKLWMIVMTVFGIVLIVYAYLMLEKYQKENEALLNDMKQLKSSGLNTQVKAAEERQKPVEKLIVQPPITIVKEEEPVSYANLINNNEQQKPIEKTVEVSNFSEPEAQISSADLLRTSQANVISKQKKPVVAKKKSYKKKKSKKLSIKQTRQLVNNLTIQIENQNTEEVKKLLKTLSSSSGENSLVFLRMNAYWSTTIKDDVTAASMYKKILFQNPQDIQANTNLALLDARNDKVNEAISRLKALRLEYPTNKSIVTYLERVENLNVK